MLTIESGVPDTHKRQKPLAVNILRSHQRDTKAFLPFLVSGASPPNHATALQDMRRLLAQNVRYGPRPRRRQFTRFVRLCDKETSHSMKFAVPPALQIPATVSSPAVLFTSAIKTEAPFAAKSSAMARPMRWPHTGDDCRFNFSVA